MIKRKLILLILACLVFTGLNAHSQDNPLKEIERLKSEGEFDQAIDVLEGWLDGNPGHPEYSEMFDEYFLLNNDIRRLEKFLDKIMGYPHPDSQRIHLLKRKAVMDEMTGRLESAQTSYHGAALLSQGRERGLLLLDSARLLFEEMYLEDALDEITLVFVSTDNAELLSKAVLLKGYVLMSMGKDTEAEDKFLFLVDYSADTSRDFIIPQALAALVYLHRGEAETAEDYLAVLAEQYPTSPEYAAAMTLLGESPAEEVSFSFSPDRFFDSFQLFKPDNLEKELPPTKTDNETGKRISVQAGSFLDEENAEYMASDLRKLGFNVEIVTHSKNQKPYYRVIINSLDSANDAQLVLRRLQESGFSGFILFH